MSPQKTGITLCRFADRIPAEASDEDASDFLSQKMREHGFKVYVRKPEGASVFENGFPHQPPMHPLQATPFPTGRVKEEIAKAKLQGPVIDYGIEEQEIRFLELHGDHVQEIASKKVAQVHWFTGDAFRVEEYAPAIAVTGLTPTKPCLRCLRPSNDFSEMKERCDFGGALKEEAKFRYEFRIHDIFVRASDLGLLQFATYKPSKRRDPFGIYDTSPAVYFAYRTAKDFRVSLDNRTKTKADVIRRLREKSPHFYSVEYVADQIFKYINPRHPRGIGKKVRPWNTEELNSFRARYPDEKDLTKGLSLIICASIWWSEETGRYMRGQQPKLPDTSDIWKQIEHYGFSFHDEISAILEVITGTRSKSKRKAKAKTKSEKRLPMQMKSRVRKAPPLT